VCKKNHCKFLVIISLHSVPWSTENCSDDVSLLFSYSISYVMICYLLIKQYENTNFIICPVHQKIKGLTAVRIDKLLVDMYIVYQASVIRFHPSYATLL